MTVASEVRRRLVGPVIPDEILDGMLRRWLLVVPAPQAATYFQLETAGAGAAPRLTVGGEPNVGLRLAGRGTGTLTLESATTVQNTLTVTGAGTFQSTLDVTGAVSLGATLNVAGAATFQNALQQTSALGPVQFAAEITAQNGIRLTLGDLTLYEQRIKLGNPATTWVLPIGVATQIVLTKDSTTNEALVPLSGTGWTQWNHAHAAVNSGGQISHAVLVGVTADQHHAQVHEHTSTADGGVLTYPRIRYSLRDPSGNIWIQQNQLGTANFVEIGANAAGDAPFIRALGTDANVDLKLLPKGTGRIWLRGEQRWDPITTAGAGGGAQATLTTVGGSGPTTAAQAGWVQINLNGLIRWLPFWA